MAVKKKASEARVSDELPLEARAIQCITDFQPPATTQDSIDHMAAEFYTASILRTHAEKRYENIKRLVVAETEQLVATMRADATETMQKQTDALVGQDWKFDLAVNKPAMKVNIDDVRTELIKRGISVDIIDAAIDKVQKPSTPALVITAKPSV